MHLVDQIPIILRDVFHLLADVFLFLQDVLELLFIFPLQVWVFQHFPALFLKTFLQLFAFLQAAAEFILFLLFVLFDLSVDFLNGGEAGAELATGCLLRGGSVVVNLCPVGNDVTWEEIEILHIPHIIRVIQLGPDHTLHRYAMRRIAIDLVVQGTIGQAEIIIGADDQGQHQILIQADILAGEDNPDLRGIIRQHPDLLLFGAGQASQLILHFQIPGSGFIDLELRDELSGSSFGELFTAGIFKDHGRPHYGDIGLDPQGNHGSRVSFNVAVAEAI